MVKLSIIHDSKRQNCTQYCIFQYVWDCSAFCLGVLSKLSLKAGEFKSYVLIPQLWHTHIIV